MDFFGNSELLGACVGDFGSGIPAFLISSSGRRWLSSFLIVSVCGICKDEARGDFSSFFGDGIRGICGLEENGIGGDDDEDPLTRVSIEGEPREFGWRREGGWDDPPDTKGLDDIRSCDLA